MPLEQYTFPDLEYYSGVREQRLKLEDYSRWGKASQRNGDPGNCTKSVLKNLGGSGRTIVYVYVERNGDPISRDVTASG